MQVLVYIASVTWMSSRRLIQGLRVLCVQSMIAQAAPIEVLLEFAARVSMDAYLSFIFPNR